MLQSVAYWAEKTGGGTLILKMFIVLGYRKLGLVNKIQEQIIISVLGKKFAPTLCEGYRSTQFYTCI